MNNIILSDKIKIASLLCTLMVIFRHSLNMEAFWGGYAYAPSDVFFIESGISTLTEIAVPYFFLVSGYFFFRTDFYREGNYIQMLFKKSRSLLIPFVIWNIVGAGILYAAHQLPVHESADDYALGLVLSEYDGALWYVRNLMLMMAAVPLYYWIFKMDRWYLYAPVLVALILWWWPVDCTWLSSEGWLFFFLGGVLQRYKTAVEWRMPLWLLICLTVVWVSFCFFRPMWCIPMNKVTTLMGIICFWQMLNNTTSMWYRMLPMARYCFFIYVLHMYVIKTMKVILAHLYPENEVVTLAAYFLLPFVSFGVLLWAGRIFNRYAPQLYKISTGGR